MQETGGGRDHRLAQTVLARGALRNAPPKTPPTPGAQPSFRTDVHSESRRVLVHRNMLVLSPRGDNFAERVEACIGKAVAGGKPR